MLSIGDYTLRTWGDLQAARYMNELEACCQMIAENPRIERRCDYIRPGLRRMEHDKHVVSYRKRPEGVFISPILHQRMLAEKMLLDGEEQES